jgi:hypothetical protein
MKTLKISSIVLLAVMLASCKNDAPKTDTPAEQQSGVETTAPATKEASTSGKYGIKSGIVEYTTKMMGMDVKQVIYFDDYGAKQATESKMKMMGTESHSVSLIKDGYMYSYDLSSKAGTKIKMSGPTGADIDFRNISEEMMKKMNLKKEGEEDFAGKTCEKYSIDYTDMKMKGTFLVWQGIALKTNIEMSSMKMEMEAKNIHENAVIPAEKFELPSDIKITEQ